MKVLVLHDRYHDAVPGGETHVVRRERALLEAHGVATHVIEWPPAAADATALTKALAVAGAIYSRQARRRVREAIVAFQPDLVHIHNFWPRATPSVHYECRRAALPVVQTLHNYRLLCAAEILLREQRPCELCIGRRPWPAVVHRCERNSVLRSGLKAAPFALHRRLDTWNRTVDAFITWTPSMRARFVRGGIDATRLAVMPHHAPESGIGDRTREYFLFVGRLSAEKGVQTLLAAWSRLPDVPLHIAGDGALAPTVRDFAARHARVRYLGQLAEHEAQAQMRGAVATIVPSLWDEPSPLVIPESYAAATPVIAADTGSRAETVTAGTTGLVFPAGDAAGLAECVGTALAQPEAWRAMGNAARARYEALHSASASYAHLMAIYAQARRAHAASIHHPARRRRRSARSSGMISEAQHRHFAEHGWLVIDLPAPATVTAVRDRLCDHLRAGALPGLERLEDYHARVTDDAQHVAVLHDLCRFYWDAGLGTTLIASHLDFFRHFVGLDLHVQKYPYLRGVRPGTARDAAMLHRDTYYGSSPYEIAVLIPFTDLPAEGALRVLSGSHVASDAAYPWTPGDSGGVTPGSPRHELGFPYAPKLLDPALVARAEPVPLRVGQAMLFSLSLVHGAGTNAGQSTRFSTDIRVVNSLAPIEWSHSVHPDYYVPLCTSPVTAQAQQYLAARPSRPR
ncbi:MAG: glycosyltransferase [bacterium]